MKEEKIKLKCISQYPKIEVLGIGSFKQGKEYEFPANIAERLIVSVDWKRVKEKKIITEENKFKTKKSEVKNG